MKTLLRLSVITLLIFTSCKGTKAVVAGAEADASTSVKSLVAVHNSVSPNFNTLASRVQVTYNDGNKEQGMTVSLRMEKDKTIWIKAAVLGITFAKAKITPDRVSYYETLSNTYFDGDFDLLSDFVGTQLNFEQTQAILLGQSIFDLGGSPHRMIIENNKYRIEPKEQPANFLYTLFLNPDNFKVHKSEISQPLESRGVTMTYDDFQTIDGGFYPTQALIISTEIDKVTRIELKYKKIDLNVSISFPFKIPEGYEEIQLRP